MVVTVPAAAASWARACARAPAVVEVPEPVEVLGEGPVDGPVDGLGDGLVKGLVMALPLVVPGRPGQICWSTGMSLRDRCSAPVTAR
jgi:hypothetical protein